MSKENMWLYFFGEIEKQDGKLVISEDSEGKEAYFLFNTCIYV